MSACAWCDGSGKWVAHHPVRGNEGPGDWRPCSHPGPVEIRALPGADWRVTKYEATGTATARPIQPSWKPPADVGRAFALACKRPVPTPEDVDAPPAAPARAPRAPKTTAPDHGAMLRVIAQLVSDFDAHNARLSERGGYRYQDTPAVSTARVLLKKERVA